MSAENTFSKCKTIRVFNICHVSVTNENGRVFIILISGRHLIITRIAKNYVNENETKFALENTVMVWQRSQTALVCPLLTSKRTNCLRTMGCCWKKWRRILEFTDLWWKHTNLSFRHKKTQQCF